jgi:hypothetical protein
MIGEPISLELVQVFAASVEFIVESETRRNTFADTGDADRSG